MVTRPLRLVGTGVLIGATISLVMSGIPSGGALASSRHGSEIWAAHYNGPADNEDVPAAVVPSPDGRRIYVTGLSDAPLSASDYATVAYDAATGAQLWTSRYDGPNRHAEYATALAVSPDGYTVVMTGESYNSGPDSDYATVAMDAATGSIRWTARYNGPVTGHDRANALAVTPNGSEVIVTGASDGGATYEDYVTIAYGLDSGAELWTVRFDGPGHGRDYAHAVSMSPDGQRAYIAGESGGDFATLALAPSTGHLLWESGFSVADNSNDTPVAMAVSPDGSTVFVAGNSWVPIYGPINFATVAIDATSGHRRWVRRFNAIKGHRDYVEDLAVSPDGSEIFVTGYAWKAYTTEFATVAYGAQSGARLWISRFGSPDVDPAQGYAEAISPDGARLYVGGLATDLYSPVYATLSYDSLTGVLVRERFFGEPEKLDYVVDIAVTSSMVFVTGKAGTQDDGWDYATVAYPLD